MKKPVIMILMYFSLLFGKEPMGYGWNIPDTPVYVGGYIETFYDETEAKSFLIDDIALLVSASGESFDFLAEVEVSNISLDEVYNQQNTVLHLERIQLNYALGDDELTLGRFNSQVGYWNQAPISFLQETTTYPHIIEHLFPKATTGVMYKGSFEEQSSYYVMIQNNKDIGKVDESIVSDKHFALSYYKDYETFSWSLAGGLYQGVDGFYANYAGIGFEHEMDSFLLQGEFFAQQSRGEKSKPYSAYIQPTWYVTDTQSMVLRLERYKDEVLQANEGIVLLGYTYRPWSNMALKAEYMYHTQEPLDRFVYSFSVMF